MKLGLEGKSAIVTGGSLGIGRSVAIELAREGADVAVNYRSHDDEAKQVVAEIEKLGRKGLAVKADVSSFADAEAMVAQVQEAFGGFDILVCNAGITWDGVIWKMSEQQWDAVIGVNLKGYFNYNRAAAVAFMGGLADAFGTETSTELDVDEANLEVRVVGTELGLKYTLLPH